MDKISKSVQDEATNGLYPKVPDTDLVPEIIHVNKIFLAFSFIMQLADTYYRESHVQHSPTFVNVSSTRTHPMGRIRGKGISRSVVDGHVKTSNKNAVPGQQLPHPSLFLFQPLFLHQLYTLTTCPRSIRLLEMMSLASIRISG